MRHAFQGIVAQALIFQMMATLPLLELGVDTDGWISGWRNANKSLNDILNLSEAELSRLSFDRQILELVDNFFEMFPKYSFYLFSFIV